MDVPDAPKSEVLRSALSLLTCGARQTKTCQVGDGLFKNQAKFYKPNQSPADRIGSGINGQLEVLGTWKLAGPRAWRRVENGFKAHGWLPKAAVVGTCMPSSEAGRESGTRREYLSKWRWDFDDIPVSAALFTAVI